MFNLGLNCDANMQNTLTSQTQAKNAFAQAGYDCSVTWGPYGNVPDSFLKKRVYDGSRWSGECYWMKGGTCNSQRTKDFFPLCYCN